MYDFVCVILALACVIYYISDLDNWQLRMFKMCIRDRYQEMVFSRLPGDSPDRRFYSYRAPEETAVGSFFGEREEAWRHIQALRRFMTCLLYTSSSAVNSISIVISIVLITAALVMVV